MKASQLRDLTRKYAAGGMPRDAYVAERTRLIDDIVAGRVQLKYRELEPASAPAHGGARRRWWLTGGSIVLVGMLLLAAVAYFVGSAPEQSVDAAAPPVAPPAGTLLLKEFIERNAWEAEELQALETRWDALPPFQQESARRSSWYRRLKHEAGQRVSEQEALLAAGQMDALLVAARLREFADRMGIVLDTTSAP